MEGLRSYHVHWEEQDRMCEDRIYSSLVMSPYLKIFGICTSIFSYNLTKTSRMDFRSNPKDTLVPESDEYLGKICPYV